MKLFNVLMIVAIIAVAVSTINLGIGIYQTNQVKSVLLAPSDVGYGQVEIVSAVHIIFNVPVLDWGAGSVNADPATLDTTSSPDYYDANWDPVLGDAPSDNLLDGGLELENYGNVDVDLFFKTSDNADNWICLDDALCIASGLQELNWWFEDLGTALGTVAACTSTGGEVTTEWSNYTTVCKEGEVCDTGGSSPGDGILVCDEFEFDDSGDPSNNEIEIDMQLVIPISAPVGPRDEPANQLEITATAIESTP